MGTALSFACFGANEIDQVQWRGEKNITPEKGMVLHVVATNNCSLLIVPE